MIDNGVHSAGNSRYHLEDKELVNIITQYEYYVNNIIFN